MSLRGLVELVFVTVLVPAVNLATILAVVLWLVGVPVFLSVGYWTVLLKWLLVLNLTISMPVFSVLLALKKLSWKRVWFLSASFGFVQASFLTILLAEPGAMTISVAYVANIVFVGFTIGVPVGLMSGPWMSRIAWARSS